jgi:uncharacterized protein (TIGR00369 family)
MSSEFTPPNPAFRERVTLKLEGQEFMRHIGFEITRIDAGEVEGQMALQQIHLQQFGRLHGGVVTTLADIVAGFAAYTMAPASKDVVTGEIKVSYLRAGKGSHVRAVGKVLKPGRTVCFVEAEVFAGSPGNWSLIAKASTSMINIDRVLDY